MQRTLVIFRHAKAAWPEGVPDVERPLAEQGQSDAPAAGRWLADNVSDIELIVRSPAVRAQQTWDLAQKAFDHSPPTGFDDRMYEPPYDVLGVVQDLPKEAATVVLVGHNPSLSDLTEALSGTHHELKTAALAVVSWHGDWVDAGAKPADLVTAAVPRA